MSSTDYHVPQTRPPCQIRPMPWSVVPRLTGREYRALLTNIRTHGVLVPIIIDELGQIIDGYHRWRAATRCGRRDVPVTMVCGLTDDEKRQLARRTNLCRRHVTAGQKTAMVEQQLRETPELASRAIARLLGVDHKLVTRARKRLEKTGEIAVVDVIETVTKDGTKQVHPMEKKPLAIPLSGLAAAERAVRNAGEFPDGGIPRWATSGSRLNKAAGKAKKERREAEELSRYASQEYSGELEIDTVRREDLRELDLPDESIDLIFTDPRYHQTDLDVYEALAALAARTLKPGCLLFTYCGKQYLPQVIERLGRHLEYVWTMADVYETGNHVVELVQVKEKYRTILVYKRPGETPLRHLVPDAVKSCKQKDDHELQNADVAARKYIEAYTRLGDVVLDPCSGGGTIPAVCVELDRHFVAFDVDPKSVKRTQRRVEAARTLRQATNEVITSDNWDETPQVSSVAMAVASL